MSFNLQDGKQVISFHENMRKECKVKCHCKGLQLTLKINLFKDSHALKAGKNVYKILKNKPYCHSLSYSEYRLNRLCIENNDNRYEETHVVHM
jgi:hypothetical protein